MQARTKIAISAASIVAGDAPATTATVRADETSTRWQPVCRVDDIAPLGARRVPRPGTVDVAVFRGDGDRVFALLDRCPHKGGPLSQGIVFGDQVACPLHNWTISLADGQAQAPDHGCTRRFRVKVDAGVVLLDAAELDARP